MTWRLRLRSWLGSVDWRAEAIEAYLARDWAMYRDALRRDPSLLERRELLDDQPAFNLALESRDLAFVRELLARGFDLVRSRCATVPRPTRWPERTSPASNGRAFLQPVRGAPVSVSVPVNAIVIARAIEAADVEAHLWNVAPPVLRMASLTAALLIADRAWIDALDVEALLARDEPSLLPAPIAAVLGGCDADVFARVWAASSPDARRREHTEIPGYGGDNDPVYAGDIAYWIGFLAREDLRPFVGS